MEQITLQRMTRKMCHMLYRNWENDDSIYMDMSLYKTFIYDEEKVNKYFDSKQDSSRMLFAIMLDDRPIGELQFKQMDLKSKECTLSIHMQNDDAKGKGYGTRAEQLAIKYAFEELGMKAVNADTIRKNIRSQHVLEKVGFHFVTEDGDFRLYRIEAGDMFEKSCGAIVYTVEDGVIKYLLVEEMSGAHSFPKGHMEEGETEIETALREIKEETNLEVELDTEFRTSEQYTLSEKPGVTKQVVYFLAKYKGSSPCITRPDEVKALKSLKLEDAISIIEYDTKKEMLKKADSYLKSKAENTF